LFQSGPACCAAAVFQESAREDRHDETSHMSLICSQSMLLFKNLC
jgi:hypothetical protein